MDKIKVQGIKIYGFHGCLVEESKIGTDYEANITVWGSLDKAATTDSLSDTMDYVLINRIVEEEVAIRAELIETVVSRILKRLLSELEGIKKAQVELAKLSPPINGNVERVSIVMKRKR